MLKNPTLFLLAILATGALEASPVAAINLDSSAAATANNSGFETIDINPNPGWASALPGSDWVSYAVTGDPSDHGYVVVPDGTLVDFSQTFNLTGPVLSASLSVMADDTSSVIVNGTTIYAATNLGPDGYPRCSAEPIGCLDSTMGQFDTAELAPYLQPGENTIEFGVIQRNLVSYGLDYAGTITTGTAETPEPSSLALIGGGLIGLGLIGRRKSIKPVR